MAKIPESPFENIAFCMSGGGYRAASFHLGAMSYMNSLTYNDKPLLENVSAISTVSGGTITGVVYALFKEQGKSFEEFYNHIILQLKTKDLIKEGLDKLKKGGHWENPYKRKNLINAFSELYDAIYTDGHTFDIFGQKDAKSHLKVVIFNATEFNHGINFRFQNEGRMGNRYVNASKDIKSEIKLADIIAASSCFPGGFEPIGFPHDFRHKNATNINEKVMNGEIEELGLLDGGIYDNQGIDGIRLSEKRNDMRYDLIIISDVSSPEMNNFRFAPASNQNGFRNQNIRNLIHKFYFFSKRILQFSLIGIISGVLVVILSGFGNSIPTGIGLSLIMAGIIVLVGHYMINKRLSSLMEKVKEFTKKIIPPFYYQHFSALNLTDYTFGQYEPLVIDRLNSLLLLIQDVFLKQIRRLNYASIYDDSSYEFRRISNLSKELTKEQFEMRTKKFQKMSACPDEFKEQSYEEFILPHLSEIITDAANFGTNLWFTADDELNDMLDKLIIAGQATMCFNLMVYIFELKSSKAYSALSQEVKKNIDYLESTLIKDWKNFNAEPHFMIEQRRNV